MADIDSSLKSVLSGISGVGSVYALQRPVDSVLPTLVYRRIGERDYMSHSARTNLERARFQITHVASTYAGLRSLVEGVKAALIGNTTNFHAAIPTEIHLEDKEADGIFVAQVDYLIFSN